MREYLTLDEVWALWAGGTYAERRSAGLPKQGEKGSGSLTFPALFKECRS